MKKILVIGSLHSDGAEAKSMQDMVAFVGGAVSAHQPCEVLGCHLDEIGYVVNSENMQLLDLANNMDIKDYDFVFFRGKLAASINIASTIALYLKQHNIPHVNTAYSNRRAVRKIPQMFQLFTLGMPVPKTVSASSEHLPKLVKKYLSFPVIVKDVQGAHGNNNHLVHDKEQLENIIADSPHITFMAQEFIENDGDYRVLIVGDQTAIIHRKGSEDSHLNNTSTGGKASWVEVADFPKEIVEQSRKFAQSCEYEIAGVDVIMNKNNQKHYFLEINSQPQLMTGAYVEHKQKMLGEYFNELLDQ